MNPSPKNDPLASREIRVFISSTFRDMMRERDLLVKRVFPALRRICAKRFVTFTEVDLRWGITEEQAAEGKVLPLCLAEIERSRPYFIGLLGERYGWIPDEIPADIVAAEPWLEEHVRGRKSVTELEILHGVLNDPAMRGHAFFYFRDPAYGLDPVKHPDLTDAERGELPERDIPWEIENLGPAEAALRTQERKDKLAALKERIRASGLPLVDPYADPEALAAIIEKQFTDLIDDLYPEEQTPDSLARERMAHEAHAKNKLFACIERPTHMAALTAFSQLADHNGKGLVVTGESGGGKTALLAAWAQSWKHTNPADFFFQHYFGATPDSSSPDGFLRRLLGELKAHFDLTDEIPTDLDKLRDALPRWLAFVANRSRVVLVLDGLNQVKGDEPDRRLLFMPREVPLHVTVIASSLAGPALETLRELGWAEHNLPPASPEEVDAMVGEYFRLLGRHVDTEGRPLQTPLRRQLAAASGCRNPLFLRTVLEELRQFGSFEQLPARANQYLLAENPKDLFVRVLQRWQQDLDAKDPDAPHFDLTRRALTHLWAAREGLSESEWLDLLGSQTSDPTSAFRPLTADPLPRAYWTPLFLALDPHLSQRSGLYNFGHEFLRKAVEQLFVSDEQAARDAHSALSEYFEKCSVVLRKAQELPWHQELMGDSDGLKNTLSDISIIRDLAFSYRDSWDATYQYVWIRFVIRLGDRFVPEQVYVDSLKALLKTGGDLQEVRFVAGILGIFLGKLGLLAGASDVMRIGMEAAYAVCGPDSDNYACAATGLAAIEKERGNYDKARFLYTIALDHYERSNLPERDKLGMINALNNLAMLHLADNELTKSVGYAERAEILAEQQLGVTDDLRIQICDNLGQVYAALGRYDESTYCHSRAIDAFRSKGVATEHLGVALCNLGKVYLDQGLTQKAEDSLYNGITMLRAVLGDECAHLIIPLHNLATIKLNQGMLRNAQDLWNESLRIAGSVHSNAHVSKARGLAGLACVASASGQQKVAVELLAEAVRVMRMIPANADLDGNSILNKLIKIHP